MFVLGAREFDMLGAISLWLFFLLYLEWKHKHSYRSPVSIWSCVVCLALGLFLFPNIGAIGFVLFGLLYAEKQRTFWSLLSPFFRGMQMTILAAPFISITALPILLVGLLSFIRNLLGDVRDTGKDKKEQMYTIPVALGLKKNIPYIHLLAVMGTTYVWWMYSNISILFLIALWLIQIGTYRLTPR